MTIQIDFHCDKCGLLENDIASYRINELDTGNVCVSCGDDMCSECRVIQCSTCGDDNCIDCGECCDPEK